MTNNNRNIKKKYNIYENIDSSMNDMVIFDLFGEDSINNENIINTNTYRNNNRTSKRNKDSTTTQS